MYKRLRTLTSLDFLLCIASYRDETKYTCMYILCRQLLISVNCTLMHVYMCVHKCVYVCMCVYLCAITTTLHQVEVILGVNSTGDLSSTIESMLRDLYRINIHTSYIMHIAIAIVLYIYKYIYTYNYYIYT